jgi:dCTP deaminase
MYLNDAILLQRGAELVSPFVPENVQPASIDLRLGSTFKTPKFVNPTDPRKAPGIIDLHDLRHYQDDIYEIDNGGLIIKSGEFVLGTTMERVMVPSYLMAQVDGRSSLARLGLTVHITAGFIDPGFIGRITLEMVNHNQNSLCVYPGDRICQISFAEVYPVQRPYGSEGLGSHYQHQETTTESRFEG